MQNKSKLFDVARFQSLLQTRFLAKNVWYFEKLPSTNTLLKSTYLPALQNGLLCITDHQTTGKGQFNRMWNSDANLNLTFTIALRKTSHQKFHLLNISVAASLCSFLRESLGIDSTIKWPNDVWVEDRKIAGFLTEAAFSGKQTEKVLIGIGINVNQQVFDKDLKNAATSVSLEYGADIDREKLLADYVSVLEKVIVDWENNSIDTVHLINQQMKYYGEWIKLSGLEEDNGRKYKHLGVDTDGYLRVLDDQMNIRVFREEQVRINEIS